MVCPRVKRCKKHSGEIALLATWRNTDIVINPFWAEPILSIYFKIDICFVTARAHVFTIANHPVIHLPDNAPQCAIVVRIDATVNETWSRPPSSVKERLIKCFFGAPDRTSAEK